MAYRPKMAAALSGATLRQLSHWRKSPKAILVPEISLDPLLYSFRDLIALRAFVFLRQDVPLQKIRTALNNLRNLGEVDHLSKYTLVAHGKKSVVLVDLDREQAVDLVEQPGQHVTVVKIGRVLQSFPVRDLEVPNLLQPRKLIAVHPNVRRGFPVVRGTRIAYDLISGLVRDGVPPDEVKRYYPGVSAGAARDAVAFAEYVDRYSTPRAA